jgi:hypothetical protein
MNRRQFLKKSSTAVIALSAASYVPTTFAAEKTKRVGLIGAGWYGKSDLWRLVQVAPVEIISICDPDKHMLAEAVEIASQRQKSRKQPRTYNDYREMLKEKDLDIVLVGSPDRRHGIGGGRLLSETDQQGRARRRGDARRRAQAQARGANRHATQKHAASDRSQEANC